MGRHRPLSRFFVIDLETRSVEIAGITNDLHQAWVERAVRGLLDAVDGFLKDARFLIHDRDPVFGADFWRLLRSAVRLPARSPDLNAFASASSAPFGESA